jgi:molybdopterin-containing oxidoreductase family membrane subunit
MAPLFIAMSFAYGLAIFLLVLMAACQWTQRPVGPLILGKLNKLLGIFVAAVLYFVAVQHLTNLYAAEHHGVERFLLLEGGIYTQLFWIGQILLGSVLPLVIFFTPGFRASRGWTAVGAGLVVLGGLTQMYVIIIGAQAYPLLIFPGMDVLESGFYDGVVAGYRPSLPEIALGVGGVSVALLIVVIALKVLPFLPQRLDDAGIAASGERTAEADA